MGAAVYRSAKAEGRELVNQIFTDLETRDLAAWYWSWRAWRGHGRVAFTRFSLGESVEVGP